MNIKDIRVGMKVRLLGKHSFDDYDDINDWFKDCNKREDVQQIKKQGYGVVVEICTDDNIRVADTIDGDRWWFLISDVEPYEEEDELEQTKPKYIFSPTTDIKDLVYDIENGTTIVYFTDGTKKIARTEEGTEFDKEIGLLECFGKKLFGNRNALLKVVESGKVIKRKKNKLIKEEIDNIKISNKNVFNRFLKGDKIAINCETEGEAEELFKILNRQGINWVGSEELSISNTRWVYYKKDTCYDNPKWGLQFYNIAWYEQQGYTIVKFKDVFQ